MAIVPNWAEPLRDSILKQLSASGLSYPEFEKIRETAELLDGSAVYAEVKRRLTQQMEGFEQSYQSALKQIGDDSSISTVEAGIRALELLQGYKDSAQRIEEAHANVERLKQEAAERERRTRKRNTLIAIAAALVVVLVLVGVMLNADAIRRSTMEAIASAQALADAGKSDDAIAALAALVEDDKTGEDYPEMYAVTETILENTAAEEGYSAAFELFDSMEQSIPDSISSEIFYDYVRSLLTDDAVQIADKSSLLLMMDDRYQCKSDDWEILLEDDAVQIADKWSLLLLLNDRGHIYSDDYRIAEAYLATLSAKEAGNIAVEAVERRLLHSSNKAANEAVSAALKLLPPGEAWELAQRAAKCDLLQKNYKSIEASFDAYISSLDDAQVWPVAYGAYKDKTVSVSDELLISAFEGYAQEITSDSAFQYIKEFAEDETLQKLPQAITSRLLGICLQSLMEEVKTGEIQDPSAWIAEQLPWMDQIPLDPDSALQLVYAMDGAGYDVAAIFPDGIALSIPLADSVCALMNGNSSDFIPDLTAVLPITIRESEGDADVVSYTSSSDLQSKINNRQRRDDHYKVLLLPDVLLRLPENVRPANYDQCTSLLCMLHAYFYEGNITSTSEMRQGTMVTMKTTTFYPFYSAVDAVVFYDPANAKAAFCSWSNYSESLVHDDIWFNANKNSYMITLAPNRFGSFDVEATEEALEEAIALIEGIHSSSNEDNYYAYEGDD